jgi:hypothetical protein
MGAQGETKRALFETHRCAVVDENEDGVVDVQASAVTVHNSVSLVVLEAVAFDHTEAGNADGRHRCGACRPQQGRQSENTAVARRDASCLPLRLPLLPFLLSPLSTPKLALPVAGADVGSARRGGRVNTELGSCA